MNILDIYERMSELNILMVVVLKSVWWGFLSCHFILSEVWLISLCSINKTELHGITDILLTVELTTYNSNLNY